MVSWRLIRSSLSLLILASLPLATACATGETPELTEGGDGEDLDMGMEADRGDLTDVGDDNLPDTDGSLPPDADMPDEASDLPAGADDYEVCAVAPEDLRGACRDDLSLEFGVVFSDQTTTLPVRLTNTGARPLTLTTAQITPQGPYTFAWVTYDTQTPPQPSSIELPYEVAAGEQVFVEVSLTGTTTTSDVAPSALEANVDFGPDSPDETISVALSGSLGGCSPGTADCDMNPATGCEIDLATNTTHCGMCQNTCMLDNTLEASCEMGGVQRLDL